MAKACETFGTPVSIEGPFLYELGEPNILVLDYAELRMGDGDFQESMEILKIEQFLCGRTGIPSRTGSMVQPWARKPGSASSISIPIELRYEFVVRVLPEAPVSLLIEPINGMVASLNGKEAALGETGYWQIDSCFKEFTVDHEALQLGKNTLSLNFIFREGVDLEAVYLRGIFGVGLTGEKREPCIQELPQQLSTGDICQQGLPFYSDRIFYQIPVQQPGRLIVKPLGAACLAFTGATGRRVIPWGDFCHIVSEEDVQRGFVICELIFNRRNTFGPLHHPDTEMDWTDPWAFRSEGENWTDSYVLVPNGIKETHFQPRIIG
jgi:hypothetical protein